MARRNADEALSKILSHEGGWADHPRDPGGATNRGVTIGTLRSLGMDLDGDGDVDVADLRILTEADAKRVFKRFYWDKVDADLLPDGVDYTVADFAVNSGPGRAAKHLQRALGVTVDGSVGPETIAAASAADPIALIEAIHASRLRFLRNLRTWNAFGRGWKRRVDEVRTTSLRLTTQRPSRPDPAPTQGGGLAALLSRLLSKIFTARGGPV